MFVYSHPDPVALSLGPLHVRWYGLMYLVGFLAGWWLARRRASRPESSWSPAEVDDLIFYSAVGVILGGRLGWMLFYGTERLMADPLSAIRIWEGGMSFHGGLLGVIVALVLFAARRGRRIPDVFDFTAPLPAIGFGAGRIGNFINGELWGKPTDVPWAVVVDGTAVHASQLYEAALEGLALFLILWWFTSRPRFRWAPSGLFLLCYLGLAISLFPYVVPHTLTLWDTATAPEGQAFLLIGTMFLIPVIFTYTGWSYWVFRGKVRADAGYH